MIQLFKLVNLAFLNYSIGAAVIRGSDDKAAFIGKSQALSYDDYDIYPLETVLAVLQLAPSYISFTDEQIFINGGTGVDKIKLLLKTTKKKDPGESYLIALRREFEAKPEGIISRDWAVICKWVMLRGSILNDRSIEANAALRVLCSQLRSLYPKDLEKIPNQASEKDKEQFRIAFKEFLGQLCQLNQSASARAFHTFLNLGQSVLHPLFSQSNKVPKEALARMFAKSLIEGLTLCGQFVPRKENDDIFNRQAEAKESRFFTAILDALLEDNIYKQPFLSMLYQSFSQRMYPSELICVQEEISNHLKRILWGNYAQLRESQSVEAVPPPIALSAAAASPVPDKSERLKAVIEKLSLNDKPKPPMRTPTPRKNDDVSTAEADGSRRRANTGGYMPGYGLLAHVSANNADAKEKDSKPTIKKQP